MTKSEFVLNRIDVDGNVEAWVLVWLESHGWYRPSSDNDGTRCAPYSFDEASSALSRISSDGLHFQRNDNDDTIFIGYDDELQDDVIRLNDERIPNMRELLRRLVGTNAALQYLTQKLSLNEWGFRVDDKLKGGTKDARARHLAEALKKHYTVFRKWKRKVDAATYDSQLCQWSFDSNTYVVVDADSIHEACMNIIPGTPSKIASEVYKQLRNDPHIEVVTEPCTDYLPMANGDLCVLSDSSEILEPTPDRFVISRINAEWRGEVSHPAVDAIFNAIEDETDRQAIKIFMGYSLTPGCGLRKALFLYGNKKCGKSTLCTAFLDGVIGGGKFSTFDLNKDFGGGDSARFGLQGLEGSPVAYCDEVGSGRIPDSGTLKSVIAGNPVSIDRKCMAKVSTTLNCKLIMCTNYMPNFQDTSSAVLDRLLTIDMRREPFASGEFDTSVFADPTFRSAMLWEVVQAVRAFAKHDEASGRWYVSGEIPISEKSKALLSAAHIKSNPVAAVFQEWYDREGNGIIGQQWSTFRNGGFDAIYKEVIGTEPDSKKIGQTQTVNIILQNAPIRNPDTGEEEHFQLVNFNYWTTDSDGEKQRTSIKGVVARFSYDTQKNKAFIAEAKDIAIRNRDSSGGGIILKMNPDYNSELVV